MARLRITNSITPQGGVLIVIGGLLLGMFIAAGLSLIVAFPVMWLWNWLVPDIFGLTSIVYAQAWGLCLLSSLLIKSSSSSKS